MGPLLCLREGSVSEDYSVAVIHAGEAVSSNTPSTKPQMATTIVASPQVNTPPMRETNKLYHASGSEAQVEVVDTQSSQQDAQKSSSHPALLHVARQEDVVLGLIVGLLRGLSVLGRLVLAAVVLGRTVLRSSILRAPYWESAVLRLAPPGTGSILRSSVLGGAELNLASILSADTPAPAEEAREPGEAPESGKDRPGRGFPRWDQRSNGAPAVRKD